MSAAIAKRPSPETIPAEDARVDAPTLYEQDYYLWCFVEADKLRLRKFSELDLPNVIEELESLSKSLGSSLTSGYRLVIAHLLKWQYQPQLRSASWEITISRERTHIEETEKDSSTLRSQAQAIVDSVYRSARHEARIETGLPLSAFPLGCPYTLDQLRDEDWMPE